MSEPLALFPLGAVLVPGLLLPLHVFEERYRVLVRELLDLPDGAARRFGVVAIRHGREVGADGVRALHDVGCTAELRRVEALADGRFDVLATGGTRFRLLAVERGARPYLVGQVDYLGDPVGDPGAAAAAVAAVTRAFRSYLDLLGTARGVTVDLPDLPDDPLLLSYLVAATVLADTADKQALLAATDAVARLRAEQALLRREIALLQRLDAVAAPDLTRVPQSPN